MGICPEGNFMGGSCPERKCLDSQPATLLKVDPATEMLIEFSKIFKVAIFRNVQVAPSLLLFSILLVGS